MPDAIFELKDVYLQPGEMFLAREPTTIRTILGSCVAVSFWSDRLGVGALCHAMLPIRPGKSSAGGVSAMSAKESYRYVDFCIRDIARQFDQLGVHRADVQVKLFGGADVLLVASSDPARPTVGKLNCETAIEVLNAEGFEVAASSLGGTLGLKIHFDTRTGEVLLQRLN
jgi:chemotaxis protein CheD